MVKGLVTWMPIVSTIFCLMYALFKHFLLQRIKKCTLGALKWVDKELGECNASVRDLNLAQSINHLPRISYLIGYYEGIEAAAGIRASGPSKQYLMTCEMSSTLRGIGSGDGVFVFRNK